MKVNCSPLDRYIQQKRTELGISKKQLVQRLAYSNEAKGYRRLGELEQGDFRLASQISRRLASALSMSLEELSNALGAMRVQSELLEQKKYAASFQPHAILSTERRVPSFITAAAICGFDKMKRVEIPLCLKPIQYVAYVKSQMPDEVPTFGRVTGFTINYSTHHAVEFDFDSSPLRRLHPVGHDAGSIRV